MRRKSKILIVIIVVCILLGSLVVLLYINKQKSTTLSSKESKKLINKYTDYKINLENNNENLNTYELIKSIVSEVGTQMISGKKVITYTTSGIQGYLRDCKEITSINSMDGSIYISYKTNKNENIILTYEENGLVEQSIYDCQQDKLIVIRNNKCQVYDNYLEGSIEEKK